VCAAVISCAAFAHYLGGTHKKYAAAIVLAGLYGPLVFFDLATGLSIWVAVLFVQDLKVLSSGPNAMGVVVGLGWLGSFLARSRRLEMLRGHKAVLITAIALGTWLTVSAAWAQSPGTAAKSAGYYWLGLLLVVVVITTVRSTRAALIVMMAFVIGGVISAIIGLLGVSGTPGQTALDGRLTGGGGDPNVQAAALVASMFVATGLMGFYRRRRDKLLLAAAFVLITIAFIKAESRGGLISLLVAAIAALVISPAQRKRVLQLAAVVVVVTLIFGATTPGALSRITDFGGGTSGRNDIWAVATLVFKDHPVIGVGANNFSVVEPNYALTITNATRVTYIAEQPLLFPAHNSYLQMLADVGVIGLVVYLAAIFACLRSGWRAARLFEETRRPALAQLARSCVMGAIGFLTAIFFITDGWDWRLWVLLGLGPALLALARGTVPEGTAAVPRGRPYSLRNPSLGATPGANAWK
jgi:O-antigen ligase